jgi:hypothetical protein
MAILTQCERFIVLRALFDRFGGDDEPLSAELPCICAPRC